METYTSEEAVTGNDGAASGDHNDDASISSDAYVSSDHHTYLELGEEGPTFRTYLHVGDHVVVLSENKAEPSSDTCDKPEDPYEYKKPEEVTVSYKAKGVTWARWRCDGWKHVSYSMVDCTRCQFLCTIGTAGDTIIGKCQRNRCQFNLANHHCDLANTRCDLANHRMVNHRMANHRCDFANHRYDLANHRCDLANHRCDLANHRYDLANHNCDLFNHRCDLANHPYDLLNHSCDLANHPCDLLNHRCDLANHNCDLLNHRCDLANHNCDLLSHPCDLANHRRISDDNRYNNNCYLFEKEQVNWGTANLHCHRHGAQLTSIKDAKENNFIEGLISNAPKGWEAVWIGLTDIHKAGPLTWTDGSPVTFANWAPGEPNNDQVLPIPSHKENCVGVYSETYRKCFFGKRKKGEWNDARCGWRCPYVCKRPIQ
ncbi:VCAN [Branchiostoma lanceolatum]|uniref:VCAN protein n=1 Tax=Branchiostoma lanceolatum TaxID=7740 RepID=A0A8J9Z044_BRALA|nr:VCAN [Branchiostoma lanceolatum]